eukprot:3102142-Pyramimonas_sp.AAC.2
MSEEINADVITKRGHRRSAYFSARSAPKQETKSKTSSTGMGDAGPSGPTQAVSGLLLWLPAILMTGLSAFRC